MDTFNQLAELALASRMRRLSDYFMREVTAVYQSQNLDFEARWFPVFHTIWQKQTIGITEIADYLNISHPAVIQTAKELENHGLIQSIKSEQDNRKRILSLSPKGEDLLPRLQPLWEAMSKINREMLKKQKHNLLFALEEMENLLNEKSHFERIMEQLKNQQISEVEILEFQPELREYFKTLNYEWIEKYFTIEEPDRKALENPESYILAKGGHIFFARLDNEIVGTCALLKENDDLYELVKMAVSPQHQGKQIGKKLCLVAIDKARATGAKQIYLESNTKLVTALEMYKKVGFHKVELLDKPSPYQRSDIKMLLDL